MKNIQRFYRNTLANRARRAKKRCRDLGVEGVFTAKTIKNLYVKQEGKCACCGLTLFGVFEVDHIKPISKGGSNFPDNLQLLTPSCNRRKSVKTMEEFLAL